MEGHILFTSVTEPTFLDQPLELRLDLFKSVEKKYLKSLLQTSMHPVLFTVKRGSCRGSEEEKEAFVEELLEMEPPFFDLEWDWRPSFLHRILNSYPNTQFILSYHDFEKTPENLRQIYEAMAPFPAFSYKIACRARSSHDALRLLLFAQENPPVSAICMGEKGRFARALGPVVGNRVGYACLQKEKETAPGQYTASELLSIYNYSSLNTKTSIYGLIGDPIGNSPGHHHHNRVFREKGINAVYVKMEVSASELAEFLPLAKRLGIVGLSVTIPLKEKVISFVDSCDRSAQEIGALNTLLYKEGKLTGTNTDGKGALDAIEKRGSVQGKKIVILGAGGAARAIAFEAKRRGGEVLILNRTVKRGRDLADRFGIECGGLEEVPSSYDILINCSCNSMPIDPKKIYPKTIVMDIVYYPKLTPFLNVAMQKGCEIIYGEEMYLNQAAGQTTFWIGEC
jgi:3-dehydroquinate dehydratase / shikimate dehydrogenase